ncbi:hypothetical protein ACQ86K_16255 [Mucilaginibacter sp. P19]|nr:MULTISPECIES: hypothetical protein [Mucilaginibacter]QTE38225.1 hypothetical protein J3L18_03895 [Mucilaginibacter gossypii]RAV60302.1 hypothetical protein DIU36_01410 [Mucilaginibacter rubeus]
MMIMQFAPGLFLREENDDILIVSYENPMLSFEKTIHLNSKAIIHNDHLKTNIVDIRSDSLVFITIDQGSPRGINTCSEIYVKNAEEICLLCSFRAFEQVNDLRKTGCYKLTEYIANRLKDKYGIEWEYKISVDTPEKKKQFNMSVFVIILTLIVIFVLIYYRLKYDMNHPKINSSR